MSGGRSPGPSAAALICGVTAGADSKGDLAGLACLAALSPALGSMGWGHSLFLGDVLPKDPTSQALGLREHLGAAWWQGAASPCSWGAGSTVLAARRPVRLLGASTLTRMIFR